MSTTGRLYVLENIPEKGQGLVAASKIPQGTRIISESALFYIPRHSASKESFRSSILAKLAALSDDQRQALFSLHNSYPDLGDELGITKTNALPLGPGTPKGGIFLESSRINHSCKPNAQNIWNEDIKKLTIHALQDIEQGSEITISYLGDHPDSGTRQQALKADFLFDCRCHLCSLPADEREASDARRNEIAKLVASIRDRVSIRCTPLQALHKVQRVLRLLKEEGIADTAVSGAYYDAFRIAVAHKDLARAKVFAERASSARMAIEGHDSTEVRRLKRLVKKPAQHRSHGVTSQWKSATKDVPQDLGDKEFEDWLWRVQKPQALQLADLRNEDSFPSFQNLPWDTELDLGFYASTDGFYYRPRKNWAFLGEIVHITSFIRLRIIVKDRHDHQLLIAFYTDTRGHEIQPSMLKLGYTVAVLYPNQHGFLDLTVGLRHEDQGALKVSNGDELLKSSRC
ncbi:hypothetical protein F66182_6032 [Fusarium sp. NRRL 66182]|nr:hypothetical protein F66182_6032 [Fusarium sp. NRRL 66182]